jgi:TATA-box binding protein (TBP) (component of TFIID and TFIIIB)
MFKLHNIKAHFTIQAENLCEHFSSFQPAEQVLYTGPTKIFSFHVLNATFFIYPIAGVVNLTGIRAFNEIPSTIETFVKTFHLENFPMSKVSVDNTTCTFNLSQSLNILSLYNIVKASRDDTVIIHKTKVNAHHFPCLRMKTNCGSVAIFSTGSVLLLGCKSVKDIFQLAHFVINITTHQCNGSL